MQWPAVLRLLSLLYFAVGAAMLTAIPWAVGYDSPRVVWGMSAAALTTFLAAAIAHWRGRAPQTIFPREALTTVALGWLSAAALGALPFLFCGITTHPVTAFFESASGFTTTGATVFSNVEALPHAINWWRTLTHWLGGMGIVVLFIAILPRLGVGAKHLFRSEVPGPITGELKPKLRETAGVLWRIYLALTLAEATLLYIAGMDVFEALCHSFATLATGGFSTRNASIGAFDSFAIELIVIVFMFLAGANFSLYHVLFSKRSWKYVAEDSELKVYAAIMITATVIIAAGLVEAERPFLTAMRQALFQVVSIQTTTGFGTDNFNVYPAFAKLLLVALMFIGGSAGSTGGGMKVVRIIIIFKAIYAELYHTFRPQAVLALKIGGHSLPTDLVRTALGFFAAGIGAFGLGTIAVSLFGIDLETSFSAVAASLWNIGPGLGKVGSVEHYGWLPIPVQGILSLLMIIGRLELFTVLVLFVPALWRR
jgi:trk system potassium uptake protein TrkH